MCFTPKISLTTALVEFLTSGYIYHRYPKSKLTPFFIIVLSFLGIYQLSEFFICTDNQIQIWGKMGFVAYAIIPAIVLTFAASLNKFKKRYLVFLLPAFFFIILAVLDPHFVTYGVCNTLFVTIRNKFLDYENNFINSVLFANYYGLYIALSIIFLIRKIANTQLKNERFVYYLMIFTIPLVIIPPLIFIIIFPSFFIVFPSIYCHFAMIITLTAIISLYYENKYYSK